MKISVINLSLGLLLTATGNSSFGKEFNKPKSELLYFNILQSDTDYEKFKKDSEAKIKDNEKKIDDLKSSMAKESKTVKDKYKDRMSQIEQKNKEMRKKIADYKANQNNTKWDSFKRDFNKGMDELGQSIQDLTSDYKK